MSAQLKQNMRTNAVRPERQQGFNLLEVLIALLVLSIGLLGLAGLQAYSIQNNTSAYQTSRTTIAMESMLDIMRANRVDALAGDYDLDFGTLADDFSNAESGTDLELQSWLQELQELLPGIAEEEELGASIQVDGAGMARIRIRWADARWLEDETVEGGGEGETESSQWKTLELVIRL